MMIGKAYSQTTKKKLAFWFKDELNLLKYQTQKQDKQAGKTRIPTDTPEV